jgi:hypothetical protein
LKTTIISYSLTGNNEKLANSIASTLKAEHVKIAEPKPRTNTTIAFDLLFNRVPEINTDLSTITENDMIIFIAPVWMGKAAFPLRSCFKKLKKSSCKYAFVSISGGALGPNLKLEKDLTKRTGIKPLKVIDSHIVDLLPPEPKPTREDTSNYLLNEDDIKKLTGLIVTDLQKVM